MTATEQVIWEVLTAASTSLYTLVGTRVWAPVAPESYTNTQPAIVFQTDDTPHPTSNTIESRVTFKCYGGSAKWSDARAVYTALADRLHAKVGMKLTTGCTVMAFQETGSALPPDPETGWPAYVATYRLMIS